MQIKSIRKFLLLVMLFATGNLLSQELGSEMVEVIKQYSPSVNDAFKIREIPTISDTVSQQKRPVNYTIFSVPVASTFTPAKGRAADIERSRPIKIYDNYATLGVGNFTSVLAELSSNIEVSRTDNFGIFFTHNSSQGGIEDVVIEDKFYDTELNLNYTSRQRNMMWKAQAGLEHRLYNWYGLGPSMEAITPSNYMAQQNYYSGYAGADLRFNDSFFDEIDLDYRFFTDRFSSMEHHVEFRPRFEVPIGEELFNTQLIFDYVTGEFDQDFSSGPPIDYSSMQIGLSSGLVVLRDDLTLNLGAALYYHHDGANSDSGVYVYPRVSASYRMAGEYFIAYAAIEGDLKNNTYYQFTKDNPFVSPTLQILPTDQQYQALVGAKGKLSSSIGYDLRAKFASEDNKALFRANPRIGPTEEEYQKHNSFTVVYDQVNTFSAFGEINFDVNRDFTMRLNGEYFLYDPSDQDEAWNLPDFKAGLFLDYQIGQSWSLGANAYWIGERQDQLTEYGPILEPGPGPGPGPVPVVSTVDLDGYFDLNAKIAYRFNDQLSAFVRGYNLLGDNYERWVDYPVLGLQVLAGITYKFDF